MTTTRQWGFAPHRGGRPVPPAVQRRTEDRLRRYAEERFAGGYQTLIVRFRGQFCYIDVCVDPEPLPADWPPPGWNETRAETIERLRTTPIQLVRLRYLGDESRWSFAFFSYASERYEPSNFPSGSFLGAPEEALEVAGGLHLD